MIDQNVLLQIDATVIAGVLILLTIGHFRNESQFRSRTPLSYRYTLVIILPFASSAIFILLASIYRDLNGSINNPEAWSVLESGTALIGFFYLIAFISVLAYKKGSDNSFDFEIKEHFWYPPEKQHSTSVFYTIMIEILLKNMSDGDTMVNTVNISFTYKGKQYSIDSIYPSEIEMRSGASKTQHFNFNIDENKIQITGNIKNAKLKIVHTHDYKEKTIPLIKQLPPRI